MIDKFTKYMLGIYTALILLILLSFGENFGIILILLTGIFTIFLSTSITDKIKKLNNSLSSRIVSVILLNFILFSLIMLSYGLSNIGVGEKGLLYAFILLIIILLSLISIIIGLITTIRNKKQTIECKPNKTLGLILLLILFILFYTTIFSGLALLTNQPEFCSFNLEMKDNSFIFVKGVKDTCIYDVARKTSNPAHCELITDKYLINGIQDNSKKNNCFMRLAWDTKDVNLCLKIVEDKTKKTLCISQIAITTSNPDLCELDLESKDECYYQYSQGDRKNNNNVESCLLISNYHNELLCFQNIAIRENNITICDNYFKPYKELTYDEKFMKIISKEKCIAEVTNNYTEINKLEEEFIEENNIQTGSTSEEPVVLQS